MIYTYTGKLIHVSDLEDDLSGKVKKRVQIVIEQKKDSYLAMWIFNENIDKFLEPVELGDEVTGSFSCKSKEYKGSWSTSIFCLSMEKLTQRGHQRHSRTGGGQQRQHTWSYDPKSSSKWFDGCSTDEDIRTRYRKLCKVHHPDKGGNIKTMQEINLEYDTLKR